MRTKVTMVKSTILLADRGCPINGIYILTNTDKTTSNLEKKLLVNKKLLVCL